MPRQRLTALALLGALACSGGQPALTDGAANDSTWARRLATVIVTGMLADSARAILQRSGFDCAEGTDSAAYLWCNRLEPSSRLERRRWQAVMVLDHDTVVTRRATFGLIGP